MTQGTFYGIGVGPGDPGLMTVKAAEILRVCPQIVVPKAKAEGGSVAMDIARSYINPQASIHELVFPMTTDKSRLAQSWHEAALTVADLIRRGDTCFLTLGDAFLYSTYIYLLRALRQILPSAQIVTIPGITSFSASAALTGFPLGEGKEPITIIPSEDDLAPARDALLRSGTVILMKIGRRLNAILDLLEETQTIDDAVLVQRAGQPTQRIETDLRALRQEDPEVGYLSVILVHAKAPRP